MHRLAAGLAAALVLTLVPVQAASASAAAGDPNFHKPHVGDCRDYAYAGLLESSDSSEPVECTSAHTAKVLATPMLPKGVTWRASSATFFRIMLRACVPALRATLGGADDQARALSAYTLGWFFPTAAERRQGARWLRCDVILQRNKRLADLPSDTAPFLSDPPLADTIARCMTGRSGLTTCSASHAWRATGSFRMPGGTYPAPAKLTRVVHQRCPGLTSTRSWTFTIRDKYVWKTGDHSVVCYSKRTS